MPTLYCQEYLTEYGVVIVIAQAATKRVTPVLSISDYARDTADNTTNLVSLPIMWSRVTSTIGHWSKTMEVKQRKKNKKTSFVTMLVKGPREKGKYRSTVHANIQKKG